MLLPYQLEGTLRLIEPRQDPVHVTNLRTAPPRDPPLTTSPNYRRIQPFFQRHRAEDRQSPVDLGLIDFRCPLQLAHPREFVQDLGERAQFPHLLKLFEEVLQGEPVLADAGGKLLRLLLIELGLGLFDQGEDVPHPEDAGCHPIGMERFEGVGLFPHSDELDRGPGYGTDGQGCTAPGVTVEFGEDHAG